MKTIEERAREYYKTAPIEHDSQDGYIAGATEQKAIMLKEIEKQRQINQSEALLNTSLHRERNRLEKEIEELKNNVSFAIKYMEAHNYQNYAPYEPENQMYASLKNALNVIE